MLGIGPMELLLILIIALLVFGPGRLPEIGAALGKAIREFREMSQAVDRELREVQDVVTSEPAAVQSKASASEQKGSTSGPAEDRSEETGTSKG